MGFLTANGRRSKRRCFDQENDEPIKEKSSTKKRSVRYRDTPHLNRLPTEILQMIFIYSANFDFPVCSKAIYHKLTGTSYLKNDLLEANKVPVRIKHQNVDETETIAYYMPGFFAGCRFITAELLKETDISGITDSRFLSLGYISPRKIRLTSYLIQQGNTVLPDSTIFEAAIRLKMRNEIKVFQNAGPLIVPCDYKCLTAAVENGFIDLARHIISLETFENEDLDMWRQLLTCNEEVVGFLREQGLHPPAQVLFGKA